MTSFKKTIDDILEQGRAKASEVWPDGSYVLQDPRFGGIVIGRRKHEAVAFARQNDMVQILGFYRLPDGKIENCLQDFALAARTLAARGDITQDDYLTAMQTVWDGLTALNSDLRRIIRPHKAKSRDEALDMLYHAIMGVGDRFNAHDIRYFMDKVRADTPEGATLRQHFNPEAQRKAPIEEKCGNMYWRASPKTLGRIEKILQQREKQGVKK